jgi:hypothetical protein
LSRRKLPFHCLFAEARRKKLSEKGARDAPGVDLAGTRRPKWAKKKHRFGGP